MNTQYEWYVEFWHSDENYAKGYHVVATHFDRAIDEGRNEMRNSGYDGLDQVAFEVVEVRRLRPSE